MHDEPKPQARGGLLSSDHSKRGRRFVTIVDPDSHRVAVLEPWEHAVLVLCDGSRAAVEIAALLEDGVEGEPVTLDAVRRCLKFFEREALIAPLGLRRPGAEPPTGPRTLANLQLAYREWHKDPVKTGQILAGDGTPFVAVQGVAPVGLSPTVALPDDEGESAPVAVGTELVLSSDGASPMSGGQRPLRSVFESAQDARTEVGALEPPAGPRAGGSVETYDEEIEDLEEELGDVADLLAAVDSDFEELERPPPGPPPVRATGGEAEIPPARDPGPATAELVVSETTQRFSPREAALTPTMVGVPAEDGDGPMIISPPRPPSNGATGMAAGEVVEDTQRFDLPTDASFAAHHPSAVDSRPPARHASVPPSREPTTNRSGAHLSPRALEVFERLWTLGLEARAVSEETLDRHDRRQRIGEAEQFQIGLERLTAGDLELALEHFEALQARLPHSARVGAFAEAVRAAVDRGVHSSPSAGQMLDDLTEAVAEAIAAGRCPRCLARLEAGAQRCSACSFSVRGSDSAVTAG